MWVRMNGNDVEIMAWLSRKMVLVLNRMHGENEYKGSHVHAFFCVYIITPELLNGYLICISLI